MRERRSWLRRFILCVLLGGVTSWLVAWAVTVAWWAAWLGNPMNNSPYGLAREGRHAIAHGNSWTTGVSIEHWTLTRLDRDTWMADAARGRFGRRLIENGLPIDRPPEEASWEPTDEDLIAASFPHLAIARFMCDDDEFAVTRFGVGWPFLCLSSRGVHHRNQASPLTSSHQFDASLDSFWSWKLPFITLPVAANEKHSTLSLPLRPLWAGLAANTAFYGLIFAVPLVFIPFVRQRRRLLKGRCPHCGYDLTGATDAPCPECGRQARRKAPPADAASINPPA